MLDYIVRCGELLAAAHCFAPPSAVLQGSPLQITVVNVVVYARPGNGEWEDAGKTRCRIFYKTPAELASALYSWVRELAQCRPLRLPRPSCPSAPLPIPLR